MERMHKERYFRENQLLEQKLDNSLRGQNPSGQASAPTMSFVMPTNITLNGTSNVNDSMAAASQYMTALSSSLLNESLNSTRASQPSTRASLRRPPQGIGNRLSMAEEEGEFMNPSRITLWGQDRVDRPEEDGLSRLSMLRERNARVAPHLRSSYPAEFPHLRVPEDSIRDGTQSRVLTEMSNNRPYALTTEIKTETVHFKRNFPSSSSSSSSRL
jgi:hypothetical protein